jgi:hypothetical protein
MNNKIVTILVVVVVLILAGGIIYFQNFQGSTIGDTSSEAVAKWIGEHSVLYVQTGCVHCQEQEALFGVNVRYLNMIDCITDKNKKICINEGIEGTPTWIINNVKYEGVQPIEKLKELTGYQD